MAKQSPVVVSSLIVLLLAGTAAFAADQAGERPQERVFNLVVGERAQAEVAQEVVEAPRHVPAVERGQWDLTLTLGYFNMEKTLLDYENLIYLATDEHFYYGDIALKNQTGFNPVLRLSYNLTSWFALEAQSGATFAEYQGSITDPYRINFNVAGAVPEQLEAPGEFDPERRSALIWINNLNGIWYPLNMDGDGRGRFHPYLIGGVGTVLYNIDSNYTDDSATSVNFNAGFGFRLIADRLISLRAEVVYQYHQIKFEPAEFFDVRDQETVTVPVYAFTEGGAFERATDFGKRSLGGIAIQVGFAAHF
jgi:hypothetical protein